MTRSLSKKLSSAPGSMRARSGMVRLLLHTEAGICDLEFGLKKRVGSPVSPLLLANPHPLVVQDRQRLSDQAGHSTSTQPTSFDVAARQGRGEHSPAAWAPLGGKERKEWSEMETQRN